MPGRSGYIGWLNFVYSGTVWMEFLCLNLRWFLGDASSRRSGFAWICGTPALLGVEGCILGGTFDYGCVPVWWMVGGAAGLVAGFILGCLIASGRLG